MRSAKTLQKAAVLRNLSELKQIKHSRTRWSGELYLLRRFLSMREELLEVHDSRDGDREIDKTARFQGKVIKYTKMLITIEVITNRYKASTIHCLNVEAISTLSMEGSMIQHRVCINAGKDRNISFLLQTLCNIRISRMGLLRPRKVLKIWWMSPRRPR